MKRFLSFKLFFFLFFIFLIFYSSYINLLPNNFLFASGDFFQFVNFEDFFHSYSFSWEDDRFGYYNNIFPYKPYYLLISFISDLFNFNSHQIAFVNQILFHLISYLSFFLCIYYFKRYNFYLSVIFSSFYSLNGFTLYNYIYTWGYGPYLIIYCFIPIYFCIFDIWINYKSIKNISSFNLIIAIIIFHLIGISFANISWYFVIIIITLVYFLLKLFFQYKKSEIISKITIFLTFISLLSLLCSWIIIPNLSNLFEQFSLLNDGNYPFSINDWVLSQSTLPVNILAHTADLNHLKSMNIFKYSALFFSILILFISFKNRKYIQEKNLIIFYTFIFLVFIAMKGYLPIPNFLKSIFFIESLFIFFRSIDKSLAFIPYFLFLYSISIISLVENTKEKLIYSFCSVFFIFCAAYPFFIGNIKTKYDLNYNFYENINNSDISMIKIIPDDYFRVYDFINKDNDHNSAVLNVPYNVMNSLGWENYFKWQHVGVDPTTQYLNKNSISLNSYGLFGLKNLGEDFNKLCELKNYDSLISMLNLFPIKFLIYHKDVHPTFIQKTLDCVYFLDDFKYINKIIETKNLILYKIETNENRDIIQLENKLVRIPNNSIFNRVYNYYFFDKKSSFVFDEKLSLEEIGKLLIDKNFSEVLEVELFKNEELSVSKINPTLFKIDLKSSHKENLISFSNSFNSFWKMKCLNCTAKPKIKHIKLNNFINGFKIELMDKDLDKELNLELEFFIEKIKLILLKFSIIFSITLLILSFTLFKKR